MSARAHHGKEQRGRLLRHVLHCDGFLLASTSASEMATKVQLFVAVSEADVDASKKPITVQNMEVAFSTFFAVMGLLLASTSTSETATNAALRALSFDTSSKLKSLSQSFGGISTT